MRKRIGLVLVFAFMGEGAAARESVTPSERDSIFVLDQEPVARSPWTSLATPGDTLELERSEVERTGNHLPIELLGLFPGAQPREGSGTAPVGAVAIAGSFAVPEISSDGWPVRLPRLDGRDLSRLLLDRLGPGPPLISLANPGDVRVTDGAAGGPVIQFHPSEIVADSSQSRVAVYHSGTSLTGGGLGFADRRGRVYYSLGLDNIGTGVSGGVSDVSTRLAMIDVGRLASWGRLGMSLRGTESAIEWRNGRHTKHDDQGVALEAAAYDTLHSAWGLRFSALDDRLSGSELPGREFRRKEARLEARWSRREALPAWLRVSAERDWFAVRFPGGVLAPRVNRGHIEGGVEVPAASFGMLHAAATLRTSNRHGSRPGGRIAIEKSFGDLVTAGAGLSRAYRSPTFDQEVLAEDRPPAEPERHDAAEFWLTEQAPLRAEILVARRRLAHLPFVEKETSGPAAPVFEFATNDLEHWELRMAMSSPTGPLGLEAGIWGSRFFPAADKPGVAPFVAKTSGRAFVGLDMDLLGGALVVRPRVDALGMSTYQDFQSQRIAGHGRLDATLVATIARQVDLELRVRNALDQKYPLAVLDALTDELLPDSGRLVLVGIRWRLIH